MSGAIVVMGVSGCGKSTLGQALAEALGWQFVEGDLLHPPENVAKMKVGIALDDTDRQPFLENVAAVCLKHREQGVVVSCSALKLKYRDLIRNRAGAVTFVLPAVPREQLLRRLERRVEHFMPASLLQSQLDALETPGARESAIVIDGSLPTAEQVAAVIAALPTGSRQS